MSRNSLNGSFNRTVHDEDTDAEAALRQEHAALSKMAQMPSPVQAPAPVPAIANTPIAAPMAPPAQAPHPANPAWHGIINAVRRPRAPMPVKVAPGLRVK